MNPDACRDVMDRSRLPYDTAPDLNKVTSGLDELSLKKQLPLRQQANKPVLKYNTSMAKSVHLFSHGDGITERREGTGVNLYSQNGMYYPGQINGSHQSFASDMSAQARHPIVQQRAPNQNSSQGRGVTSANPYVGPVSATEVAANINGDKARKMVEVAAAISNITERTATAIQAQTVQRNSFLRPLSGTSGNRERPSSIRPSPTPHQNPQDAQLSRQNSFDSDTLSKRAAEAKFTKKTLFDFASTTSSTVVKPHLVNHGHSFKESPQIAGTVSHLSKPLPQGHAEMTVRNPSYSPNKPYVNPTLSSASNYINPQPVDMKEASQTSHFHSYPDMKYNSESEDSNEGTVLSTNQPHGPDSGTLKKMPVTNTLTGTVYYRKTSLVDSLSKSGNQTVALGSINSQKTIMPEQNSAHQTTSLKKALALQDTAHKKLNDIPPERPTLERANASLQLQSNSPGASDMKTVLRPIASPDRQASGGKSSIVTAKPPLSSRDKQAQRQGTADRVNQHVVRKKASVLQRSQSDKMLNSNVEKKPQNKRGSLSTTAANIEQRPQGDGAPARPQRGLEKSAGNHVGRKSLGGYCDDKEDDSLDDDDYDDNEDDRDDDWDESSPSGERLPGDGEASVEDYDDDDDDDEDALDNFEDTNSEGGSDGYSITSAASSLKGRPATAQLARRASDGKGEKPAGGTKSTLIRPVTASGDIQIKPAFRFSLFNKIPPTLNFVSEGEKTEQLPWELRKLLKWKMSPITPIVVKVALGRVGFRVTKRNHDWLGCFGKHMKAQCFKSMREYQKLNHFPGSFQIGRKDRLWRNLSRLQLLFGKAEFNFFPQTYVLPCDLKQLKRAWDDSNTKQKWIIKPPASARGIGIKVINKWTQIPRRRPVIVQKYLHRPYLINDSKFDMRIYVYVTSYDPLRIYVYDDGLARFASCKYSSSMKSLSNKFMHLTNYSVNKKNIEYTSNTDNNIAMGHKWSLKTLWNYLKRQGINTSVIWDNIRDLIIKTIICGDSPINSMTKSNARSRYCCHELFGFDVLLDENLKPWILEVNISPSLHSNSPLDINIKGGLIKDMMNLAGFRIPDERDVSNNPPSGDFSAHKPVNKYCMDKRLFTNQLSPDERAKHAHFCQKHQDEQIMQSILDTLTPDDIRLLCESIDEDSRKGSFQRLFPTPHTHRYLRFFQAPRYYNLLLDQWVLRYNRMEQRGILLLQSFCDEGVHLENPTSNSRHQWVPPNSTAASYRSPDVRVLGSLNSARGSGPAAPPRGLPKKPGLPGTKSLGSNSSIVQSNSSNSLTSLLSSPQLHSPSPIGPISSPSR